MLDNRSVIYPILDYQHLYHMQLIVRGSPSRVLVSKGITKVELENDFELYRAMANATGARVYLNITPVDKYAALFNTIERAVSLIRGKNFDVVSKISCSVLGTTPLKSDKVWLIDLDEKNLVLAGEILNEVANYNVGPGGELVAVVPTVKGYHLLVRPFNLGKFTYDVQVHKNNPTILYTN
jgi:hypothetical protein